MDDIDVDIPVNTGAVIAPLAPDAGTRKRPPTAKRDSKTAERVVKKARITAAQKTTAPTTTSETSRNVGDQRAVGAEGSQPDAPSAPSPPPVSEPASELLTTTAS